MEQNRGVAVRLVYAKELRRCWMCRLYMDLKQVIHGFKGLQTCVT